MIPRIAKLHREECTIEVSSAWGGDVSGELVFNRYKASVWHEESSGEGWW